MSIITITLLCVICFAAGCLFGWVTQLVSCLSYMRIVAGMIRNGSDDDDDDRDSFEPTSPRSPIGYESREFSRN